MATHITERQKPRSAKNEAFEVVGKVGENNPVGRHITVYACTGQDCSQFLCTSLARDGYTNGIGQLRRTLRNRPLRGGLPNGFHRPLAINSGNHGNKPRTWRSVKTRADKILDELQWKAQLLEAGFSWPP